MTDIAVVYTITALISATATRYVLIQRTTQTGISMLQHWPQVVVINSINLHVIRWSYDTKFKP